MLAFSRNAVLAASASSHQRQTTPALTYDSHTRGPVPIPPSERGLQTVVADQWFKVSRESMVLEGPCFDRAGNLLFAEVYGGRVLRLSPDKYLTTVFSEPGLGQAVSRSITTAASSLPP